METYNVRLVLYVEVEAEDWDHAYEALYDARANFENTAGVRIVDYDTDWDD